MYELQGVACQLTLFMNIFHCVEKLILAAIVVIPSSHSLGSLQPFMIFL